MSYNWRRSRKKKLECTLRCLLPLCSQYIQKFQTYPVAQPHTILRSYDLYIRTINTFLTQISMSLCCLSFNDIHANHLSIKQWFFSIIQVLYMFRLSHVSSSGVFFHTQCFYTPCLKVWVSSYFTINSSQISYIPIYLTIPKLHNAILKYTKINNVIWCRGYLEK